MHAGAHGGRGGAQGRQGGLEEQGGFPLVKSQEISRFSQGGAAAEQGQQHLPHVPPCLHVRCGHHCHHHHGPRHDPPLDVRRSSSRLLNMFSKKAPAPLIPPSVAVPAHTRQMAAAAVLLEEWLQELAALAQVTRPAGITPVPNYLNSFHKISQDGIPTPQEHSVLQQEDQLFTQ